MNLLRERELNDNIGRQLYDEQRLRGMFQKRLRKERRTRRGLQHKLELELKRRGQLEEALRNSSGAEQLRLINDSIIDAELQLTLKHNPSSSHLHNLPVNLPPRPNTPITQPPDHQQTKNIDHNQPTTPINSHQHPQSSTPSIIAPQPQGMIASTSASTSTTFATSSGHVGPTVTFRSDLMPPKEPRPASASSSVMGDQQGMLQQQQQQGMMNPATGDVKPWGYTGLDLINSSAAFWQNYSDSLAQELDLERKTRQQHSERDVKSPLQDRAAYYKNSVLFTSSAT